MSVHCRPVWQGNTVAGVAGAVPADRQAPQCPRCSASDPGPILLPCLVGQTWMRSPTLTLHPQSRCTPPPPPPLAEPPLPPSCQLLHKPKGIQCRFFCVCVFVCVWDGRSVINLGAWVFSLCVKTCRGEGRLANSQTRSPSTEGGGGWWWWGLH